MAEQRGSYRWRGDSAQLRVMVDGVPRTKSVKIAGRDEHAAQLALATFVFETTRTKPVYDGTMTVGQLADLYWRDEASDLSANTRRSLRLVIDAYVIRDLGHLAVVDVTPGLMRSYFADLKSGATTIKGKPAAPSTLRKIKHPLRRMFALAVLDGVIAYNPVADVRIKSTKWAPPVDRLPQRDALRSLLTAIEKDRPEFATAVRLAAATGACRGELCALRWTDIDLDGGALWLRRSVGVDEHGNLIENPETKGKRARGLTLSTGTVDMLRVHRRRMAERALACGSGLADNAYVFSDAGDSAAMWPPQLLSQRWRDAAKRYGLAGQRFHDLRHLFITGLFDAGMNAHDVQAAAGHASLDVTNAYTHARQLNPAVAAANANAL